MSNCSVVHGPRMPTRIDGFTAPGASWIMNALGRRFVKGSTGGPDAEERSRSGSRIVAVAYDAGGTELARVDPRGFGLVVIDFGEAFRALTHASALRIAVIGRQRL